MINELLESEMSLLPRPDEDEYCPRDVDKDGKEGLDRGFTFGQIAQLHDPRIPMIDQPGI